MRVGVGVGIGCLLLAGLCDSQNKAVTPEPSLAPAAVIEPKQLGRMLARMRVREGAMEISALAEGISPTGNLTAENFRQIWGIGHLGLPEAKRAFARCRELYAGNDFVGWFADTMVTACNDGCRVNTDGPDGEESAEMVAWLEAHDFDFAKLAHDLFLERVLCSNAVIFWRQDQAQSLPDVAVLDSEACEVLNAFGAKMLKVTMKARQLTAAEREELGERYAAALSGKELVVKNGEFGEYYRFITGQKNGAGLRLPRLYQIFQDLSLRDLLRTGDWNAAWLLKNIIRLVRRGHEIKVGPLAGQDIHFLKAKEARKIRTGLATNAGSFDMVTNFDVTVSYSHLDPKYLATAKYEGVKSRLHQWLGPLGQMLDQGQIEGDTMKAWEVQCRELRGEVGRMLNRMLNHPDFLGGEKPPLPIQVTWSENTFLSFKLIMERVRLAQAAGISSTRTGREDLSYDHARESARLKAEHADPASITPAFEQKQGMGGANAGARGGRPAKNDVPPVP